MFLISTKYANKQYLLKVKKKSSLQNMSKVEGSPFQKPLTEKPEVHLLNDQKNIRSIEITHAYLGCFKYLLILCLL